jgi:hypothetical protein
MLYDRIVGVIEGEIMLWRANNLGKANQPEPKFNNFPSNKDIQF